MKRATFFKPAGPASPPTPAAPAASASPSKQKRSRQSIRGRISAPIPMPDPLAPNDYPVASASPAAAAWTADAASSAPAPPQSPSPAPDVPIIPENAEAPAQSRASPAPLPEAMTDRHGSQPSKPPADSAGLADPADSADPADPVDPVNLIREQTAPRNDTEPPASEPAATDAAALPSMDPDPEPALPSVLPPAKQPPLQPALPLQLHPPKVRPATGSPAELRRLQAQQAPQAQARQALAQQPIRQPPPQQPQQDASPPRASPPRAAAGPSRLTVAGSAAPSPAFHPATSARGTLRHSATSAVSASGGTSTENTTVSGSPNPQRKKSTLRGALSKLFGRRKKTNSQIVPAADAAATAAATAAASVAASASQQGHEAVLQHRSVRSDPTVLGRPRDSEPKRSASLPITEYDRALRSHSIGPEDIAAIETARSSFQVDRASGSIDAGGGRRRAAPATNRILFPAHGLHGPQGHRRFGNYSADVLSSGGEWTGLSPRPASAHGRGSSTHRLSTLTSFKDGGSSSGEGGGVGAGRGGGGGGGGDAGFGLRVGSSGAVSSAEAGRHGVPDPFEIGRAITSDTPGGSEYGGRRRSRSLSGLNDLALEAAQARRRSVEIRYWRESYDPAFLSPLSSGQDMDVDGTEAEDPNERNDHDDADVDDNGDDDDSDDDQSFHDGRGNVSQDTENYYRTHGGNDNNDAAAADSLFQNLRDAQDSSKQQQREQQQQQEQQQQPQPKTPPRPFPFGNLYSLGTSPGSLRITQANSIDARLGSVEARLHQMERVIDQLCHTVPGFKGPFPASLSAAPPSSLLPADPTPRSVPLPFHDSLSSQPAIPPIPAMYQAQAAAAQAAQASSLRYSSSRHSGHSVDSEQPPPSHMSFGDGQTYIGSLHPPSSSATQAQSIYISAASGSGSGAGPAAEGLSPGFSPGLSPGGGGGGGGGGASSYGSFALRPNSTSTSTVRGATSLPALGAAGDSQTALLAQLDSERAVRQALERQVKKLNERVNSLSTTMYAMLRDPAAKPRSSREPLLSPSSSSLREQSAAAAAAAAAAATAAQLKAESVLQTAKALGHRPGPISSDDTESEGFRTPIEDAHKAAEARSYMDDTDDADLDNDAGNPDSTAHGAKRQKKAARTLSLGQLTLRNSTVQA